MISLYKIKQYFKDWIYPGYCLKNFLFNRYDLIKIPNIKPWQFAQVQTQIFCGVMQPLKKFIQSNPQKYVLWYKDEKRKEEGPKYGDYKSNILFPQLRGKYILDLAKEVYKFYTVNLNEMKKDYNYLLDVWNKYIVTSNFVKKENTVEMVLTKSKYNLQSEEIKNLNWNIILKYCPNKNDFFKQDYILNAISELDKKIYNQQNYYLHLAIEIRQYLWT